MTSPPARTSQKNPKGGQNSSTKRDVSAEVLPVTNPLDLWYLCEKAQYAGANPYKRASDEAPMYQRTVALWIRADNELFEYRWPYCAEGLRHDAIASGPHHEQETPASAQLLSAVPVQTNKQSSFSGVQQR